MFADDRDEEEIVESILENVSPPEEFEDRGELDLGGPEPTDVTDARL